MIQKELWDEFGFKCDRLKDCRCVIQNEFREGLSEKQAAMLISSFEENFRKILYDLGDSNTKIKEYIWSQIK